MPGGYRVFQFSTVFVGDFECPPEGIVVTVEKTEGTEDGIPNPRGAFVIDGDIAEDETKDVESGLIVDVGVAEDEIEDS